MDIISLHPEWLDKLFAYKSKVRAVFSDVLGLHEINHIALAYISKQQTLTTLSSTPAIEYNLFSSALWQYDACYQPTWFQQGQCAHWQSLYAPERYDELYYIKQTKPRYPLGLAMAGILGEGHVICSVATATDSDYTRALFQTQHHELQQVGQYCTTRLMPLLLDAIAVESVLLHTPLTGAL